MIHGTHVPVSGVAVDTTDQHDQAHPPDQTLRSHILQQPPETSQRTRRHLNRANPSSSGDGTVYLDLYIQKPFMERNCVYCFFN